MGQDQMAFQPGVFQGDSFQFQEAAATAAPPQPHNRMPRIFWTLDGYPLALADWSYGAQADLGYAQARGVCSAERAREAVSRIEQGSVLRAYTESATLVYEGEIAAVPRITQDGLAHIAGQGFGIRASKYQDRLTGKLAAPGAWVPSNLAPLDFAMTLSIALDVTTTFSERSVTITTPGGGSDWAIAFWARGMKLGRVKFTAQIPTSGGLCYVYSADGPGIGGTARVEHVELNSSATGTFTEIPFDVTFQVPGDAIIIRMVKTGLPSGLKILSPKVWGDYPLDALYGEHLVRMVANRMGWDDDYVLGRGSAPFDASDWAGDAASYMSQISALEDWTWGVYEDRGAGPVLHAGPYGARTFEVSAATGARWDLDPLERFGRVTCQFLYVDNTLGEITLDAPEWAELPEGLLPEARVSLGDPQESLSLASAATWTRLRALLAQRYRGTLSLVHAYLHGRDAVYEIRGGDQIRIVDFSADGDLIIPVHDVECGPTGVRVGTEALAFPSGGLSGGGGRISALGTGLASRSDGTSTYLAPGSFVFVGGGRNTPGSNLGRWVAPATGGSGGGPGG